MQQKRKYKKPELFDVVNTMVMILILVIIAYPLWYTIIASLSSYNAVAGNKVIWTPVEFTLDAYKNVFANKQIWVGYRNSFINTILGTSFNLIMTIPSAYAMSKKYLPYKGWFTTFFLISMYFGGGMIPTYLLIKNLKMIDTRAVLVILGNMSVYNLIITRTFFQNSIPESLYESAEIDGAGEFRKFFSIALPLSKPIIAVMLLYSAVGHWNSYFNALLYTSKRSLETLQLVLRRVLISNEAMTIVEDLMDQEEIDALLAKQRMTYVMKYSVVFIASAPMLIAYPFVQKYFVKGVMIGSIKG